METETMTATQTTTDDISELAKTDTVTFTTEAPGLGRAVENVEATVSRVESEFRSGAILGAHARTAVRARTDDGKLYELVQYETKEDGHGRISVTGAPGGRLGGINNGDVSEFEVA